MSATLPRGGLEPSHCICLSRSPFRWMACLSRKCLFKSHPSLRVTLSSAKARKGLSCHLKACAILILFRFNADLKNVPATRTSKGLLACDKAYSWTRAAGMVSCQFVSSCIFFWTWEHNNLKIKPKPLYHASHTYRCYELPSVTENNFSPAKVSYKHNLEMIFNNIFITPSGITFLQHFSTYEVSYVSFSTSYELECCRKVMPIVCDILSCHRIPYD